MIVLLVAFLHLRGLHDQKSHGRRSYLGDIAQRQRVPKKRIEAAVKRNYRTMARSRKQQEALLRAMSGR